MRRARRVVELAGASRDAGLAGLAELTRKLGGVQRLLEYRIEYFVENLVPSAARVLYLGECRESAVLGRVLL
jgi:hypothetical protein